MADNNPAGHAGRRNGADHVPQIAAEYNHQLDSLVETLLQLIRERHCSIGPANITDAPIIMLICAVIKIIRQKLLFEVGRQDTDPSLQLAFALIAVALGCVMCSFLMNILLGDMPWPIFVTCIVMLVILFVFLANRRIN